MSVRVGEQRALRMRRIGARHMVVMPPQVATVITVDQLEQALRDSEAQVRATEGQLAKLRALAADLRRQVEAFNALPVQRDDDDPEVPQPPPSPPEWVPGDG